ncbi:MAG: DedA family protein [bacterium]
MQTFTNNIGVWLDSSKYFLLFAGAFLEGPAVMIGAGFLYRIGTFAFFPMYLCLVFGDFVADLCWYFIGYFGAKPVLNKFGRFLNVTPEIIKKVELRFKTYESVIILISKLTMGFGFSLATLIVAGMLKMDFKKYVSLNLLGGFVWTFFMISVGFIFGNIYSTLQKDLKIVFVGVFIFLVFFGIRTINRFLVNQKI